MAFGERILLALSIRPGSKDYLIAQPEQRSNDTNLGLLKRVYPGFEDIVNGKNVLDFGCGEGYQAIALARQCDSHVVGVDSNPITLAEARVRLNESHLHDKVEFVEELSTQLKGQFDVVISQNSMEHFPDPVATLREMVSGLKENGILLVSFGPPWYAPYGSHMQFFTKVPWVNIWFSEKTVMKVRSRFRNDGAKKYEEVESGLNKMSVTKFEQIIRESRLQVIYKKYDCVKGLNFLSKIPFVKELFINHISCILRRGVN